MLSYEDMKKYTNDARISITHGGPGSIFMVLDYNKVPIVVPRQSKFKEHVNNHQVEFSLRLKKNK